MSSSENGSFGDVAIQLDHVTRKFGKTNAVDDVSFHVRAGEVFGYIGPNGAGKTTSMRILATLDVPTSGEAWVDGFSVVDDPDRVRRRLGWMPDEFGTYPNVNCREYLDFFARSYGLRGNDRLATLRHVMGFTQLDQMAEKPVDGLSKGMKQRLCLGRALIHDPKVLILDEPAAGLDPRARIELREMIGELASRGKSLLISSHILTELAEMCDRVGIIEQGKMLAVGTVEEILEAHSSGDDVSERDSLLVTTVVVSDVEAAVVWLKQREGISRVEVLGMSGAGNAGNSTSESTLNGTGNRTENRSSGGRPTIQFTFSRDLDRQAELLAAMIAAGIRVAIFAGKQKSLEEAFLKVTRGRVQ